MIVDWNDIKNFAPTSNRDNKLYTDGDWACKACANSLSEYKRIYLNKQDSQEWFWLFKCPCKVDNWMPESKMLEKKEKEESLPKEEEVDDDTFWGDPGLVVDANKDNEPPF